MRAVFPSALRTLYAKTPRASRQGVSSSGADATPGTHTVVCRGLLVGRLVVPNRRLGVSRIFGKGHLVNAGDIILR